MKPFMRIAVGLVWHQGQLVVGRRSAEQTLGGYDEFPGGKCEPGEEPSSAVVRECEEETGLRVKLLGPRDSATYELEKTTLELFFFDLELLPGPVEPSSPFSWWSVEQTLAGKFPPANAGVLESIRKTPRPPSIT
jgi:8-oxo-dGTP diphosphatase